MYLFINVSQGAVVVADMSGVEVMIGIGKETGIETGTVTGIAGGLTAETETGGK